MLKFAKNFKPKSNLSLLKMFSSKKPMDGNTAAAYVSYFLSDIAFVYPMNPATMMGELVDKWSAEGKKNIFGLPLQVNEMQSEGGVAGALHGALAGGALATTFSASQGLLLMIPNMHKIAGELMPAVIHIASRVVGGQALSIYCDHSDVMETRLTGFAIMGSGSVQEVMDLGFISHLSTLKASIPFLHFFDGYRTSHEVNSIDVVDRELMKKMVDYEAIERHRARSLNPEHPHLRGSAQSPDVCFQAIEALDQYYKKVPYIVQDYMDEFAKETGRQYHLFDYVGHPEAERVIVVMGSGSSPVEEIISKNSREKIGLIKVRLYRPFSVEHFLTALPKTVKRIAVLDRVKENGAPSQPLQSDVMTAVYGRNIDVVGGRFGIGSKEFTPAMVRSVYDNLGQLNPKNNFTVGINDDINHTSLTYGPNIDTVPDGTKQCIFWGIGSDGTVGANKNAIKIIVENTNLQGQGYFSYSAHKSGGVTVSHLRFGPNHIESSYMITNSDYIACHQKHYLEKYDSILTPAKKGSKFILNSPWNTIEELNKNLPNHVKREIAQKGLEFYNIDASKIADEVGLTGRINMIMQAVFFKLSNVLPEEKSISLLKKAIEKEYSTKGGDVIQKNKDAVDMGIKNIIRIEYPNEWKNLPTESNSLLISKRDTDEPEFVTEVMRPIMEMKGNSIPLSKLAWTKIPSGTSKYEKRGFSDIVPKWDPQKCIQCNLCSLLCPHAAIRPFLISNEEKNNAPYPDKIQTLPTEKSTVLKFALQISPYDCTGCSICSRSCPEQCLEMVPSELMKPKHGENWDYMVKLPTKEGIYSNKTIKDSQFCQPLLEFSGACAGCGETPVIKLVTQLFGDQMIIANATGCSSIWGGTFPLNPYTSNQLGHGPAWGNSLFEDNAEYGIGIAKSVNQLRFKLLTYIKGFLDRKVIKDYKLNQLLEKWVTSFDDRELSNKYSQEIQKYLEKRPKAYSKSTKESHEACDHIWKNRDLLAKKSIWIQGGDGWAYDIGYGGLDHVLASGEDVNILVLDTEAYSNTGGQSSKSTPRGAVAKLAISGKQTAKKDLGMMAMTYGDVYVASICLGADPNQAIKAITEAEKHKGVSLIIAYCPCIEHGIKGGLSESVPHSKDIVKKGYHLLYRYNPILLEQGKNPMQLDSTKPEDGLEDILKTETRYESLRMTFPEEAKKKQEKLHQDIQRRYQRYLSFKNQFSKMLKDQDSEKKTTIKERPPIIRDPFISKTQFPSFSKMRNQKSE
ncbi:pyruvate-flavodoxin oxidoreductase-related [Anaeramoeba ignava]|uniref:Pyruvate-flavodoxin oxidoreductase-related n=1 Tax=Anaeramoeba ignava TaxID=1746090 RepID=A0A9Q0L8X9_ANAIG|nr:pyruvate-flavodoxin oxidoreductase-related [Anaeramoeba ignava]